MPGDSTASNAPRWQSYFLATTPDEGKACPACPRPIHLGDIVSRRHLPHVIELWHQSCADDHREARRG